VPLNPTGQVGTPDADRNAIGFWMIVKGVRPVEPVRVLVTFEALGQMEPSEVRDVYAAIKIFDRNRARIEDAASDKFDTRGVGIGQYEGRPVVVVRWEDLTFA
jgi:Protein of unknown function (DUF1488)